MRPHPLRVVIVEDSAVQRAHLRRVLESDGTIKVVGEATAADEAAEVVAASEPDAVTMDLHIPGGGVTAIEVILAARPVPILVLSVAVAKATSTLAFDALAAGAVDAVPKPARWDVHIEAELRERVRNLRGVRPKPAIDPAPPKPVATTIRGVVVGLAASTGGPPALAKVLSALGPVGSPLVVVQHLPPEFTDSFVEWLRRSVPMKVQLAGHNEPLEDNVAYVGRPGQHLRVVAAGTRLRTSLSSSPDSIHRPSADELFRSLAAAAGPRAIGVQLTGMGEDGAAGLLEIKLAGGHTIVQDQATSTVFGMPRAAIRNGSATAVVPLGSVASAIAAAARART